MELWDQAIEPYAQRLQLLDNAALSNLVLDVVESTIPLFDPPFGDFFPTEYCDLIESAIAVRAGSPTDWQANAEFAESFLARYDELPEVAIRPAVGPFLMALVRIFEAPADSVSADDAMESMSSCYESVLMSQLTGRVTLKDEEDNERCRECVGQQVGLILRYSPPGSSES